VAAHREVLLSVDTDAGVHDPRSASSFVQCAVAGDSEYPQRLLRRPWQRRRQRARLRLGRTAPDHQAFPSAEAASPGVARSPAPAAPIPRSAPCRAELGEESRCRAASANSRCPSIALRLHRDAAGRVQSAALRQTPDSGCRRCTCGPPTSRRPLALRLGSPHGRRPGGPSRCPRRRRWPSDSSLSPRQRSPRTRVPPEPSSPRLSAAVRMTRRLRSRPLRRMTPAQLPRQRRRRPAADDRPPRSSS